MMLRGERAETVGKPLDEIPIRRRQRQREHGPGRRRAHRGEIGKIHREGFPANVFGQRRSGKMHAGDDRVGRRDELMSDRWREHRGIVADADAHVGARRCAARPQDFDQFEFHDALPALM